MTQHHDAIEEGLTDTLQTQRWVIFVVLVGLASCVFYARDWYSLVSVNENLAEVAADVFWKYFALVVAVERAAAVFVGMFRNQKRVDWSLRINRISEVLQMENPPTAILRHVHAREQRLIKKLENAGTIAGINAVPDDAGPDEYLGYLTSAKHAYEFQRARFNSVSNRYVARVVFFVGIILAALGLSLFQDLLQISESAPAVHSALLRFADIFVTGGLLGGGSAGLNAVATKVADSVNRK